MTEFAVGSLLRVERDIRVRRAADLAYTVYAPVLKQFYVNEICELRAGELVVVLSIHYGGLIAPLIVYSVIKPCNGALSFIDSNMRLTCAWNSDDHR